MSRRDEKTARVNRTQLTDYAGMLRVFDSPGSVKFYNVGGRAFWVREV